MSTSITWRTSASASGYCAAWRAYQRLPFADPAVEAAIRDSAVALFGWAQTTGCDPDRFASHLLPLCAQVAGNLELARSILAKTHGRAAIEPMERPLVRMLGDVERAMASVAPRLEDELPLRVSPLRMQWEARGPGMMNVVDRWTDPGFVAESALAVLVLPVAGGGGLAHAAYNAISLEAVLADGNPRLPEVLRMVWLLAQLNLDLPRFSEPLSSARAARIGGLGLIPLVLSAGAEVELCVASEGLTGEALRAWSGPAHGSHAAPLWAWWRTYLESRPPWGTALVALDQMLGEAS
jgi:hypothetical protein